MQGVLSSIEGRIQVPFLFLAEEKGQAFFKLNNVCVQITAMPINETRYDFK